MKTFVPLIRRFTKIVAASQSAVDLDEMWLLHGRGERVDWSHLQSLSRAVILADAGAGKTFELRDQAEKLSMIGRAAFFIRIEDIDADFAGAFGVGTRKDFERWLNGADEAWFFLDSVDEVRLETPRAFETAMRAFADRIRGAKQRAHIIVSSRPYAWRADLDGSLIEDLLPFVPNRVEAIQGEDHAEIRNVKAKSDENLQLYRLAPLDHDQILLFAGHRDVQDIKAFVDALERNALYGLAQLPFDLEDLIAIWNSTGALDSRLAVLEQGLCQRLGDAASSLSILPLDRALSGARRLALATTLIGEANIRLPCEANSGIDASAFLPDWSPQEVLELLSRGIFSDAIYSMVRFRHREVRELLAARGLADALCRPGSRPHVEALIFRDLYGEAVVVPRLRPLLPWLILFDAEVRDRALALRPEIAIEGGDPAQLPIATRVTFLRDIVAGIISKANRGGDNGQIARIAQPDLEDTVLDILNSHYDDDGVVFFLGRLAWQGSMRTAACRLGPIATDPHRDIFARVVSARAVMSVGGADRRDALWAELQASGEPLPRRLLAELMDGAPADVQSVERLLALFSHLEPYDRFAVTGLTRALHSLIDRLPMTHDQAVERPLVTFVAGLTAFLFREPFIHASSDCRVSQEYFWLMAPAIHAVERLIIFRSDASLAPPALKILTQAFALKHHGGFEDYDYKSKIGESVPRWIELNDALFWYAVAQAREQQTAWAEPLVDDWRIGWPGHFWHFDAASFARTLDWVRVRALQEDRSLALSRSFRTYAQNGRPRRWRDALWRAVRGNPPLETRLRLLMRPPPNLDRRRWRVDESRWTRHRRRGDIAESQARAQFVLRLKACPESVRNPPGLAAGELSSDQFHLFNIIRGAGSLLTRSGGGNWEALIPEFGEAVAQAYRDAALRHWRAYRPGLRSEGVDGRRIPYSLLFAMAGIEIEAGPDGRGLETLSDDDARHAIRYAFWEINGFPDWFEPLFRTHRGTGIDLIGAEIRWEMATSSEDRSASYIIHDIAYRAHWLHTDLADSIYSCLEELGAPNADVLRYSRMIMVGGGSKPEMIAALARGRIRSHQVSTEQLPMWFALWVDADPTDGIDVLEAELSSLERVAAATFSENFLSALMGDRNGGSAIIGAWMSPPHLRRLYTLMHKHIRIADDIHRSGKGVYSPTVRDDAQRARDHLFTLLADIPGEPTYRAIQELAFDHPELEYRAYMRGVARERATSDSERTWTEQQVCELFSKVL